MRDYVIEIKTDKNLGSRTFVRQLLEEWCNYLDERLRPEFFALGEPVRRSFASEGIETAVEAWLSQGMGLYLRRRSKPKFLAGIEWFRREKGLDPRLFPWSCIVWLSPSAGDELSLKLLHFLIRHFEPAFGFITIDEDHRDKHFLSFEDIDGVTEMYVGQDILENEETLPGVYWLTYFGPWAVERIGSERFADLKAEKVESIDGGYLVQAYGSGSQAGGSLARQAETRIGSQLGKQHFFDKALVNIEALKTSPEEAELVEEKLKEHKAKKKRAK